MSVLDWGPAEVREFGGTMALVLLGFFAAWWLLTWWLGPPEDTHRSRRGPPR